MQGWSKTKCLAITGVIGILFGGIEVALVEALKVYIQCTFRTGDRNMLILNQAGQRRDLQWPVIMMGVLSTVLLSAGVLRHYFDIYIHRTVRGISFIFVGIDAAGDVFSLVSVCKSAESLATAQGLTSIQSSNHAWIFLDSSFIPPSSYSGVESLLAVAISTFCPGSRVERGKCPRKTPETQLPLMKLTVMRFKSKKEFPMI
jgi:hypothetical protein